MRHVALFLLAFVQSFAAISGEFDENPVPAVCQNATDVRGETGHPRVLILGNSITRHGPKPSIGWTNNCGMAASSIDKDYVHVLAKRVKAEFPAASFAMANVSGRFERRFQEGLNLEKDFGWMRDWKPDAVIMFFGANCPKTYDPKADGSFGKSVELLRNFLANGKETRFLISEGFYNRPVLDAEKQCVAEKYGDVMVPMADIRASKVAHGRYNHPSDEGMRMIAERFWDYLEPLISDKGPMHLYGPVNFDKSKIGEPKLEDPLTFVDGSKVKTAADWRRRREEILDIFAKEMLGQPPPEPEAFEWEVISEKLVFAGFARFRHVRTWYKADRSGPHVDWFVFLPRFAEKPVPPILQLNYRGVSEYLTDANVPLCESWGRNLKDAEKNRGKLCNPDETSYCPLPMILAKGYAFMTACYCDIAPDPFPWTRDAKPPAGQPENFPYVGVFDLWPKRDESKTDNTTVLGAWAWALSRGLDLAERMTDTDAKRAVVTGCSRLGKAAFVAAARDERFKVCVVNQSGGGGVTLAKRNFGESIKTEMTTFRHWYCSAYDKYADDPSTMPFDQHLLVATIAPRALLVQGFDDFWYDTEGEYLSCKAASPVWKLLGGKGLPSQPFPKEMDTSCIGADLGYVRRYRQHGLSAQDWTWLLDFSNQALAKDFRGEVASEKKPWTSEKFLNDPEEFHFAIIPDRTGGERKGVFQEAINKLNLLRPEFVMSVGDIINGGGVSEPNLRAQWKEAEDIIGKLEMPFFYVIGNHDVWTGINGMTPARQTSIDLWREHCGTNSYYNFMYKGCHFVCFNTMEKHDYFPPREPLSEAQVEWALHEMNKHSTARWHFLFMHKPLDWTSDRWLNFERKINHFGYTVFCGDWHNFCTATRHGKKYYMLGTCGGCWEAGLTSEDLRYGIMDAVAWVTMTKDKGPVISYIKVSGVMNDTVQTSSTTKGWIEAPLDYPSHRAENPLDYANERNAALIPTDVTNGRDYDWHFKHAKILRQGRIYTDYPSMRPNDKRRVVLLGDETASALATDYKDSQVYDFGFKGDKIENVLWRVIEGELLGYEPDLVVISVGKHNTNSPDEIKAALDKLENYVRGRVDKAEIKVNAPNVADELDTFWDTTRNVEMKRLPMSVVPVNVFDSLSNTKFQQSSPELENRIVGNFSTNSVYNVVTLTLRSIPDLSDKITEERVTNYFNHAHAAGIKVLMDIDARIARREFLRRYPEECAEVVCVIETNVINGVAKGKVAYPEYRDHMAWGAERGYSASNGEVLSAFAVKDGISRQISVETMSVSNEVICTAKGLDNDERLIALVKFRLFAVDPASPMLTPFLTELAERYRKLGADGAMRDEWGFPPMRDFHGNHSAFPYSRAFVSEYAKVSGGRDYVRDLCALKTSSNNANNQKVVEYMMKTIYGVCKRTEQEFYDMNYRVFGPDVYVTKHPTWHCRFDASEFMHNGLDWWGVKRDWAQSDESIPLPFILGMSKKCGGPCWMNEGYGPCPEHYGLAVWRYALCGGRMVYHGIYGGASSVKRKYADLKDQAYHVSADILTPSNIRAQARVNLLNLISRSPINSPVAMVFGHWRAMNWIDSAYRDDGLSLAHNIAKKGFYVDEYPSSQFKEGTFIVDKDGYLAVGKQRYEAIVLHRLSASDINDFATVCQKGSIKTKIYSWDSPEFPGAINLTSSSDDQPIVRYLESIAAVKQTPLSDSGLHSYGEDKLPRSNGVITLIDGTKACIRGSMPNMSGDEIGGVNNPLVFGDVKVFFEAKGLCAARVNSNGEVVAFAAGGLSMVKASNLSLKLDGHDDIALVLRNGKWFGFWQTSKSDAKLPAELQKLTDNWRILRLPKGS